MEEEDPWLHIFNDIFLFNTNILKIKYVLSKNKNFTSVERKQLPNFFVLHLH